MERKQEENWHIVGVIPEHIAKYIGLEEKTPIWISDKIVGHITDRHRPELQQRHTTAIAFVHKVVSGFNSIYRQSGDTLILAIEGSVKAMVTYIKLELASDNYWRVKSAHWRDINQLSSYTLIWTNRLQIRKPAKRR